MNRLLTFIILIVTAGMIAVCSNSNDSKTKNLALLELLTECGNGNQSSANQTGNNVYLSPNTPWSIYPGQAPFTITAAVANDSNHKGVAWTISGGAAGSLTNQTTTSVTYNPPSSEPNPNVVDTVTATSMAYGTNATLQVAVIQSSGSNVQQVSVNGGPLPNLYYADAAFTSVKICTPGSTTNCQTIAGILVDTGSYGLRILASQINSSLLSALTPETGSSGTINNCAQFVDGSYLWGPVVLSDVYIAGEVASSTPIQIAQDPTQYSIPNQCSSYGQGIDDNSLYALGATGILGVGSEPNDCGPDCAPGTGSVGFPGYPYYECTSSGCQKALVAISQQVTNPVINFSVNNNGVILELPSVSDDVPSVYGSLIFGINTVSNNQLNSAAIFPITDGFFITTFNGQSLTQSFVDSGSNGLFFNDPTISACSDDPYFYCPSTACGPAALNFSAINQGTSPSTVNFIVNNADTLFDTGDFALNNLAGSGFANSFDWGLPFFYGRRVFTAIDGKTVSGAPPTPFWAY